MNDIKHDENSTPDYLAALDIGSNSFHFVLARQVGEHVQIMHSEKYRVRLAQGLLADNNLSQEAINRGISTLEHLAATTQNITPEKFKVVATFTLRQAKNSREFLKAAARVFPFGIEIISGHEEARLIYHGVAHHRISNHQQLVIDIGGGSTECIIGKKHRIKTLDSLNIGCVSFKQQFFPTDKITEQGFVEAVRNAKHQIDSIVKRFKKVGWEHVIGTSGTIKAITSIVNCDNELARPFTLKDLKSLRKQMVKFGSVQDIVLPGLKENRREVLCSGIAILTALMESLEISSIEFCKYALREGVLFEQLENLDHNNIRVRTVDNFSERFNIDIQHANNVRKLAGDILNSIEHDWLLKQPIYKELLASALLLHEIGMDINTSGFHKHGQYILEQADLAGFNREQQKALAWLVGNQRKKIAKLDDEQWYLLDASKLLKLCFIIRLSVLLNQQRNTDNSFLLEITSTKNALSLTLEKGWLLERPIIDTELFYERQLMDKFDYKLVIKHK